MTSFQRVYDKVLSVLRNDPQKAEKVKVQKKGACFWIIFNRPTKMNAFSTDMYIYVKQLIQKANQMLDVKYIIVCGTGGNFSSGNDLKNFIDPRVTDFPDQDKKYTVKTIAVILKDLCQSIIDSRKPIYAIVEGHAVGFAFTQLALYDKVFAVKGSEFYAPLVKIAQGPQMCSSYLFPKIFGKKMASEIIIEAKKIGPETLQKYDFLQLHQTRISAENALMQHLKVIDSFDWESFIAARHLINEPQRDILRKVNENQCTNLIERWLNPNLVQFLMKYLENNKSKGKK